MVGTAVFRRDGTDIVKFTQEFTFRADHQSSMDVGVDETLYSTP